MKAKRAGSEMEIKVIKTTRTITVERKMNHDQTIPGRKEKIQDLTNGQKLQDVDMIRSFSLQSPISSFLTAQCPCSSGKKKVP